MKRRTDRERNRRHEKQQIGTGKEKGYSLLVRGGNGQKKEVQPEQHSKKKHEQPQRKQQQQQEAKTRRNKSSKTNKQTK